jgi:aspartyl-tRNA(Asn)/glutamyl-tRNA(Gln) amidotransferase subunit C
MKREDVAHLATLARIELSETELTKLEGELSSIVSYVSAITDIAGEAADTAPQLGARFNVLRPDVVTNEADEHTEVLLAELPSREGRYMKVKKILGGTE